MTQTHEERGATPIRDTAEPKGAGGAEADRSPGTRAGAAVDQVPRGLARVDEGRVLGTSAYAEAEPGPGDAGDAEADRGPVGGKGAAVGRVVVASRVSGGPAGAAQGRVLGAASDAEVEPETADAETGPVSGALSAVAAGRVPGGAGRVAGGRKTGDLGRGTGAPEAGGLGRTADDAVLDNPAYAALTGPHAHLAERSGRVLRYPGDVSPWLGLPDEPGPADWADLAAFAGADGTVPLPGVRLDLPEGWELTMDFAGVQMVGDRVDAAHDPEAVRLTAADVPEMLDLVARTRPGPFLPRTIELGTYLGIRRGGALVAMAGERLRPPGWTEISAVCTDPEQRGQGLAGRLVRAVAAGVLERGETPFLHTGAGNTNAIRLYETLGFRLRRTTRFRTARVPGARAA